MTSSPQVELPQLWQKPAFEELKSSLLSLRAIPPTWDLTKTAGTENSKTEQSAAENYSAREAVSYLTNIIKSSLDWIEDDEQREELWEQASKRLSERCGRTAMPSMVRHWSFSQPHPPFSLALREPALTEDSLGHKTWGSSYVLAQMLAGLSTSSLAHLFSAGLRTPVLELGSGTGLLGLAAAAVWGANVILTDMSAILPNLAFNVEQNRAVVEARGGSATAAVLTWGGGEVDEVVLGGRRKGSDIVLLADGLYDDHHPEMLAEAIHEYLALGPEARAVVMAPQRDKTARTLLSALREDMARQYTPLVCIDEGVVFGQDDWGDGDGDEGRVECWWGIFRRANHDQIDG